MIADVILWVIVAWVALGAVVTISMVGKPRQSTTPAVAATATVLNALIIIGLVYVALSS